MDPHLFGRFWQGPRQEEDREEFEILPHYAGRFALDEPEPELPERIAMVEKDLLALKKSHLHPSRRPEPGGPSRDPSPPSARKLSVPGCTMENPWPEGRLGSS